MKNLKISPFIFFAFAALFLLGIFILERRIFRRKSPFSSCVILEEEFCKKGKKVFSEGKFAGLGFDLPKETKIFAPYDGYFAAGNYYFPRLPKEGENFEKYPGLPTAYGVAELVSRPPNAEQVPLLRDYAFYSFSPESRYEVKTCSSSDRCEGGDNMAGSCGDCTEVSNDNGKILAGQCSATQCPETGCQNGGHYKTCCKYNDANHNGKPDVNETLTGARSNCSSYSGCGVVICGSGGDCYSDCSDCGGAAGYKPALQKRIQMAE